MPIKPDDILKTATFLAEGSSESDKRSAVSRAYYSAFHSAKMLLNDFGLMLGKNGVHNKTQQVFNNCNAHPNSPLVASKLGELKADRECADYDLEASNFQGERNAEVRIAIAMSIANMIQELSLIHI